VKSHRNENDATVQPNLAAAREADHDVDPMAGKSSSLWLYLDDHRVTGQKEGAKGTYDEETLTAVSGDLVDVLQHGNSRPRGGRFALAIMYLEWAKLENIGVHYTADTRLGFLDSAMKELKPVLSAMEADSRWNSWLYSAQIKSKIGTLRAELNERKAQQRIEAAAQEGLSSGATAEDPAAAGGADAVAKRARAEIAKFLEVSNKVTELANKALTQEKDVLAPPLPTTKGELALDALNDALGFASAFLAMTDDEFAQKQHILHGTPLFEHVRTRVELSKTVFELINSGLGMTAKTTRLIAMVLNKPEIAAAMERIGDSKVLGAVGAVSTGLSFLSSVLVLFDATSTDQQKIDAGVSLSTSLLTFGSKTTAATLLGATYALASYSAELYWASRSGIMQVHTGAVFKEMARNSDALVRASERLVITSALLDAEQDEGQKAALANIQKSDARTLGATIDAFLAKSQSYTFVGSASKVGTYQTLREAFAPHQKHAGKTDPHEVLVGGAEIIKQIAWCFENAQHLVQAETAGGGLATAEALKEEDTKKQAEEARRQAETRRYYDSLDEETEMEPEGWSVDDGGGA
jgi:hypothetical protein